MTYNYLINLALKKENVSFAKIAPCEGLDENCVLIVDSWDEWIERLYEIADKHFTELLVDHADNWVIDHESNIAYYTQCYAGNNFIVSNRGDVIGENSDLSNYDLSDYIVDLYGNCYIMEIEAIFADIAENYAHHVLSFDDRRDAGKYAKKLARKFGNHLIVYDGEFDIAVVANYF